MPHVNVVYIRKVKKSESKSQLEGSRLVKTSVVYIRKVKKSESKSQLVRPFFKFFCCCVYP